MDNGRNWSGVSRHGRVNTFSVELPMDYVEQLKRCLREKSLVRGEVVLSSGKKSDYYLDCKLTTLSPEGAFLTGNAILELMDTHGICAEAIGGLAVGADPIVSAVVLASHLRKRPIQGFLVREASKKHGRQKQVEGIEPTAGRKVVIVDEVCTTGKSTIEAIRVAESVGMTVVAVISLVDREEGGSESLKQKYNYHAVCKAKELLGESERPAGPTRDAPRSLGSETSVRR